MAWILRAINPPKTKTPRRRSSEELLWWSVLHQAARDLDLGNRSDALDAYEFLEGTGKWIAKTLFEIDPGRYERELDARVRSRFGDQLTFLLQH